MTPPKNLPVETFVGKNIAKMIGLTALENLPAEILAEFDKIWNRQFVSHVQDSAEVKSFLLSKKGNRFFC